ncbi:hypothetical protein BJF85_21135 [Saccharomonospora sp. CUA-673]|nr:hypothetical protein BJF85_21135 [Saccharomonospora sp. CUA-673]
MRTSRARCSRRTLAFLARSFGAAVGDQLVHSRRRIAGGVGQGSDATKACCSGFEDEFTALVDVDVEGIAGLDPSSLPRPLRKSHAALLVDAYPAVQLFNLTL